MTTCADFTAAVGAVVVWTGVETVTWSLAQFTQASQAMHALGVDTLCVKCQDAGTLWYNSQGGISAVQRAVEAGGCKFLPFAYLYGNKYGDFNGEQAAFKTLFQYTGVAQADMEAEWDGQVAWATTMRNNMLPIPGMLSVSTWANPAQQNWSGVISALGPAVNSWTPQEYDNYLVGTENEWPTGECLAPGINLPEAWPGPNDPLAATQTAYNRGHRTVFLWEYQLAVANPNVVRSIVAIMKGGSAAMATLAALEAAGWKDDGTTLTAPNGYIVTTGFRDYILTHAWAPGEVPVGNEQTVDYIMLTPDGGTGWGGGSVQYFLHSALGWSRSRDVIILEEIGLDAHYMRSEIATLQAQLLQAQQAIAAAAQEEANEPQPVDNSAAVAAANAALTQAASSIQAAQTAVSEVK